MHHPPRICAGRARSGPVARALRIVIAEPLAYWTVVADDYRPVPVADAFLGHLRLGRDRAEATTKAYAHDLCLFFEWAAERDLLTAARNLHGFVTPLRTEPLARGRSKGQARSPQRINRALAAVREALNRSRR